LRSTNSASNIDVDSTVLFISTPNSEHPRQQNPFSEHPRGQLHKLRRYVCGDRSVLGVRGFTGSHSDSRRFWSPEARHDSAYYMYIYGVVLMDRLSWLG